MRDKEWVARLRSTFDPDCKLIMLDVTPSLLETADLLYPALKARLYNHYIPKRVMPERQSHWCLRWAAKNLSQVAAYMVLFQHAKKDVTRLGETKCLLVNPAIEGNRFLHCTNDEASLHCAYLHYCTINDEFVRAGKATTDGGFAARNRQHETRARANANPDNSRFYDDYPHSSSIRSQSTTTPGLFECLTQYVAVGFDETAAVESQVFEKDYSDGGLFSYEDDERASIKSYNFNGKKDTAKFSEMVVAYFI